MTNTPDTTEGRIRLEVLATKLDYLIVKVDVIVLQHTELGKRLQDIESKQQRIDATVRVISWVGGVIATITIALLIRWLSQAFGL